MQKEQINLLIEAIKQTLANSDYERRHRFQKCISHNHLGSDAFIDEVSIFLFYHVDVEKRKAIRQTFRRIGKVAGEPFYKIDRVLYDFVFKYRKLADFAYFLSVEIQKGTPFSQLSEQVEKIEKSQKEVNEAEKKLVSLLTEFVKP